MKETPSLFGCSNEDVPMNVRDSETFTLGLTRDNRKGRTVGWAI
jgi:hypothetical protein